MTEPAFVRLAAAGLCLGLQLSAASLQAAPASPASPMNRLQFDPQGGGRTFERSIFHAMDVHDPWEPLNRRMYYFNYRLDQWVMLPAVRGYEALVPSPVRTGVSHFFSNLGDFGSLANSLLQLKGRRAMTITARLLFNTLIGVGGIWDPATRMGLPKQSEDLGQTLGHYGVPAGPYLILPLLGPSNLRDGPTFFGDYAIKGEIDLLGYYQASNNDPSLPLLQAIDMRETTDFRYGQLNSPFEYEQLRYIYTKSRELQVAE